MLDEAYGFIDPFLEITHTHYLCYVIVRIKTRWDGRVQGYFHHTEQKKAKKEQQKSRIVIMSSAEKLWQMNDIARKFSLSFTIKCREMKREWEEKNFNHLSQGAWRGKWEKLNNFIHLFYFSEHRL